MGNIFSIRLTDEDKIHLQQRMDETGKNATEVFKSAIYFTKIDTDLFVIATTNDTRYMPPSLLRPGRFDYVIYLQPPIGENAENIVSYYLRDKDLAEDVLISDIVKAILHDNRDFLLAVQKELLEHETLLNSDLAKIWESCT